MLYDHDMQYDNFYEVDLIFKKEEENIEKDF